MQPSLKPTGRMSHLRKYEYNLTCHSLERLQHYLDIEHEEKGGSEDIPPAYWPASGALYVSGLCARYSKVLTH